MQSSPRKLEAVIGAARSAVGCRSPGGRSPVLRMKSLPLALPAAIILWALLFSQLQLAAQHSGPVAAPSMVEGDDLPVTVRLLVEKGNAAFARGDAKEASAFYAEARKVLPDHMLLLINSGLAEFRLGNHAEAEQLLRRALRGNPELPQPWQVLGLIYLDSGRYEQAMAAFAQFAVLDPRNARAHNYLGVAIGQMGWFDGAESEFRRAIELDPNYADAHFNLAYFALRRRTPAVELARRHYAQAVKLGAARDEEIEAQLTEKTKP